MDVSRNFSKTKTLINIDVDNIFLRSVTVYQFRLSNKLMTAVKWDGNEKVNQYWGCHSVNWIDDFVVLR